MDLRPFDVDSFSPLVGAMEAAPKHFLSSHYVIRNDGVVITELRVSSFRERARFEILGDDFELMRERPWGGEFMMKGDHRILARARKPSLFRSRFEVRVAGRAYEFVQVTGKGLTFVLVDGMQQVGQVYQPGTFTSRTIISLPSEWPVATRIFVFWLALVIWNRD